MLWAHSPDYEHKLWTDTSLKGHGCRLTNKIISPFVLLNYSVEVYKKRNEKEKWQLCVMVRMRRRSEFEFREKHAVWAAVNYNSVLSAYKKSFQTPLQAPVLSSPSMTLLLFIFTGQNQITGKVAAGKQWGFPNNPECATIFLRPGDRAWRIQLALRKGPFYYSVYTNKLL